MTGPPSHEIVVVPDAGEPGREELLQECFNVRIDVFHHEQKFPLETEIDELSAAQFSLCLWLHS